MSVGERAERGGVAAPLPTDFEAGGAKKWLDELKGAVARAKALETKVNVEDLRAHLELVGKSGEAFAVRLKGALLVYRTLELAADALMQEGSLEELVKDDVYVFMANFDNVPLLEGAKPCLRELEGGVWSVEGDCWPEYGDVRGYKAVFPDLDYKGDFGNLEPLASFLEELEGRGVAFWLAFSGGGFHLYLPLDQSVGTPLWKELQSRTIELAEAHGLPVKDAKELRDPLIKVRLIGTLNHNRNVKKAFGKPAPTFWVVKGEVANSPEALLDALPLSEHSVEYEAKRLYDMGYNVLPVRKSDKKPKVAWSDFQKRRPAWEEIEKYFKRGDNLAVILGKTSDNLAVLDFETEDDWDRLKEELTPLLAEKLERSWKERSKRGLHVFFKLPFEGGSIKFKEAEIRASSSQYVLVYPSVHPDGVRYQRLSPPEAVVRLDEDEWEELVKAFKRVFGAAKGVVSRSAEADASSKGRITRFKKLSEKTKNAIVNAFKPFFEELLKSKGTVEGVRHNVALYLSGWLAKERVDPADAIDVVVRVEALASEIDKKAKQEVEDRVNAVAYSYRKVYGQAVEELLREAAGRLGVKLYGGSTKEVEVGGKGKLRELLKSTTTEELAKKVISAIEGALEMLEDAHMIDVGDDYIVNSLKECAIVYFETRRRDIKMTLVVNAALVPWKSVVLEDPVVKARRFKLTFVRFVNNRREEEVVQGYLPDVLGELRGRGGWVVDATKLEATINALIGYFEGRGLIKRRIGFDKPTIFKLKDGSGVERLVFSGFEVKDVSPDEVKEALELLERLSEFYEGARLKAFATVIKWSLAAPFSYAKKQEGHWARFLLLVGDTKTGKTTLGKIALALWYPRSEAERVWLPGSAINNVPRLGNWASQGSKPILVNEVGEVFERAELREMLKAMIEGTVARGKYHGNIYVPIPATTPMIFTTNKAPPAEDALLRRFVVIRFDATMRPSGAKIAKFERLMKELDKLNALGAFALKAVKDDPSLLEVWDGSEKELEFGELLLRRAYEFAGLEPPEWASYVYEEEDVEDSVLDALVTAFKHYIMVETKARDVCEAVKRLDNVSWISVTNGTVRIMGAVVTIAEGISDALKELNISSLESLRAKFEELVGHKLEISKSKGRKYLKVPCEFVEVVFGEAGARQYAPADVG